MTPVEVRLGSFALGEVSRFPRPGGERIAFRYADEWLTSNERFQIARSRAEAIIREVQGAVRSWEATARKAGASRKECARMRSAFLER